LFESCNAKRARLDAIWPHSIDALPRCGVPRKIINFVRARHVLDLRNAYTNSISTGTGDAGIVNTTELTSLVMMPPRLCTTNNIGSYNLFSEPVCPHSMLGRTSFSMSRSSLTARSRPCCDTLFWLFAWKKPLIMSAL
jgi:hypothetical protein